jgi:hypothetical protein
MRIRSWLVGIALATLLSSGCGLCETVRCWRMNHPILGTITAPASRPGNRRANSSGTATRAVSVSRNSQRPMLLADRRFAERHSA